MTKEQDMIDDVTRRYAAGETRPQIAAAYGLTPAKFSIWCKSFGLRAPNRAAEDKARRFEASGITAEKVREMTAQGMSVRAITAEFGLSYKAVRRFMRENGIEMNSPGARRKLPRLDGVIALLDSGRRPADIARDYGVSEPSVYRVLHRAGYCRKGGVVVKRTQP